MLNEKERNYLLESLKDLLDEYDYDYTLMALNKIIDEWSSQKADLIEAFKKHPNYVDGKFMIAFTQDYERVFNEKAICDFERYIIWTAEKMVFTLPEDIDMQRRNEYCSILPDRLYNFLKYELHERITSKTISAETAQFLEEIIPQIHPHAGEKASRVINRLCQYLNYDKDPNYNREFAKFADGLSPITIKRHTVLSINPLDYLTMSFGNSWASCHTIDKENKRDMPDSYEGMYSSGTMSYMLDGTSMVFYTVDAKYDGNDYWTQPKINRQMFHWGEEKLVQSRLYPQDNDGCSEEYSPYRNIVQSIMSIIFNFPNLWKLTKGIDAASRYIYSDGTHYRDYCNFSSCSLSRISGSENEKCFHVGATPICINCGERHSIASNINHCAVGRQCDACGCIIEDEDDECWVGDYCYCRDCVSYCSICGEYVHNDDARYIEHEDHCVCEHCLSEYYTYCEDCEEYYRNEDCTYIESEDKYVCCDCRDEYYASCDECGEYILKSDLIKVNEEYYCEDCYEERFSEAKEEE